MKSIIYLTISVALSVPGTSAFASGEISSAKNIMVGCRAFAKNDPDGTLLLNKGFCIGVVDTLRDLLPSVCVPQGLILGETVRVVVKYIDDRPSRHHEQFWYLAAEALKDGYPCR